MADRLKSGDPLIFAMSQRANKRDVLNPSPDDWKFAEWRCARVNLDYHIAKASFYDPEINRTYGAMAAHLCSASSTVPSR